MKILLVKLISNGDCLLATPIARQIKEVDYPGCRLTWLIASRCRAAIENNPYVDEIIETDEDIPNERALLRYSSGYDLTVPVPSFDRHTAYPWGTLHSFILRGYGKPLSVPIDPILNLTARENKHVADFAEERNLTDPELFPILFECSPLSGQSAMDFEMAFSIARTLTRRYPQVRIILSSKTAFEETSSIFDGSRISWRENAALTGYCKLLLGCSSGITWLNYSTAGAAIPTLQFLEASYNAGIKSASVYLDFIYHEKDVSGIYESYQWNRDDVVFLTGEVIERGFEQFKQHHPVSGPTTKEEAMYLFLEAIGKRYSDYSDPEFMKRHMGIRYFAAGLAFTLKRKCYELLTGKISKGRC